MSGRTSKGIKNTYFIEEHGHALKHVLEEAFKIQRIKFTSYDASKQYIVFGANIGSLYVYRTENITKCIKVLPSNLVKPIIIVSISPNEDNILFVDETGQIIIFENCFTENPYQSHVFNQQKGKRITTVKWEGDNKVYTGDNEGNIALLSIKSKLMLSLLHTPYVSLMDLHSKVVQIDILSPLLLITTERKTYVCNQEQERYRQVGTQETVKGYGACFVCNTNGINLYCSRPGLRLWQADIRGDVFSTLKFKGVTSLITEILKFGKDTDSGLQVEKLNETKEDKIDFGQVHTFGEKFLCIMNRENIFILDPEEKKIIFHYYSDQKMDVRLVKNKLFIKFSTGKISILNFYKFEELMNEIYFKKQYSAGMRLLLKYRKNTMDWLKSSPNVKLVTNLEHKIKHVDNELAQQFTNFLNEFKKWEKEKLKEFLNVEEPKTNLIKTETLEEQTIKEQLSEEIELMCKKYDLFKSCNVIYMPQFSSMLLKLNEDEMADLFAEFIEYKKSKNEEVEMYWCYKEYIHHFDLKMGYKKLAQLKAGTVNFLKDCYINVEAGIDVVSCSNPSCNFPLPSSKRGLPKHDKVGEALVRYIQDDFLFKKRPYLWYHKLNEITTNEAVKEHLSVILQFGYISIFQKFKEFVTYNFCHDLIKLFLELKGGKCLNCGTTFSEEYSKHIPSLEKLAFVFVPLIGSDNILRILLDFQRYIPQKDALSEKFYLGCIFSEIENKETRGENAVQKAVDLLNNVNTEKEFRDCMSAFLMSKIDKSNPPTSIKKELTCISCKATLQHPVFKQVQQLECGHAFHAICLRFNNNICTVCTPNQ